MKKTKFCILGIIFTLFAQLYAYSQESPVKPEVLSELKANGSIRRILQDQDKVELTLCPDTPLSKLAASAWTLKDKPKLVSENLFYISKDELKKKSSEPAKSNPSLENVSVVMRSISKMKGMKYYSNTHKKWETLYHQAYVCKSVKDKKKSLPDVTEGSAEGLKLYCFLEDNSFGKSVYTVNYRQNAKEVSFELSNAESWSYALVTALEPKNMVINMVVIDNDDSYIIYMVLQAKHTSVPFLGDKIQKSLASRIDAIFNWFTLQF